MGRCARIGAVGTVQTMAIDIDRQEAQMVVDALGVLNSEYGTALPPEKRRMLKSLDLKYQAIVSEAN